LPVLTFDGNCGFCSASARFVTRWVDRHQRYEVQPWQRLELTALELTAYGLTEGQCREALRFVTTSGEVRSGHRAIIAALRLGAPGWRLLGVTGVDCLTARAHVWVAEHRYQLRAGTPACGAPGTAR